MIEISAKAPRHFAATMDSLTPHQNFISLLVVATIAFLVPLLLSMFPRVSVPMIVGEIVAGIAMGAGGLDWIRVGPTLEFLFLFGLAYLLLLAGLEIDFRVLARSVRNGALSRSPLIMALAGFVMRLVVAGICVALLSWLGLLTQLRFIAILLTSTSLGVVLTVLRESGRSRDPFGQVIVISSAIADLGTVLLLSIFFSREARSTTSQVLVVTTIVLVAALLLVSLRILSQPVWVRAHMKRLSGRTTQLGVRGSLAVLLALVALAGELGAEAILGAFLAGVVLSILVSGDDADRLRDKLETVGYSFFVPMFFVIAGARVNIRNLLAHHDDLILVPVLFVCVLLVKLGPIPLLRRAGCSPREAIAGGVLQSAQLTFTIAGVEIGRQLGLLDESRAAALVLVAIASVIVAPLAYSWIMHADEARRLPAVEEV